MTVWVATFNNPSGTEVLGVYADLRVGMHKTAIDLPWRAVVNPQTGKADTSAWIAQVAEDWWMIEEHAVVADLFTQSRFSREFNLLLDSTSPQLEAPRSDR